MWSWARTGTTIARTGSALSREGGREGSVCDTQRKENESRHLSHLQQLPGNKEELNGTVADTVIVRGERNTHESSDLCEKKAVLTKSDYGGAHATLAERRKLYSTLANALLLCFTFLYDSSCSIFIAKRAA
jgi:hypothetical protein